MLKKYIIGGLVYQFEEGTAPKGAQELKPKAEKKAPAEK